MFKKEDIGYQIVKSVGLSTYTPEHTRYTCSTCQKQYNINPSICSNIFKKCDDKPKIYLEYYYAPLTMVIRDDYDDNIDLYVEDLSEKIYEMLYNKHLESKEGSFCGSTVFTEQVIPACEQVIDKLYGDWLDMWRELA